MESEVIIMGAWDYSIFDNDSAQEVVQRWEEWIDSPKAIGYKKAIDRYFKYWGEAIEYGDPITNSEVIALLGLHLEKNIVVPAKLKEAAVTAVSIELELNSLNSWDNPEKRKEALLGILSRINAKPKVIKRRYLFKDPALEYRSSQAAKKDLLVRAKKMRERVGSEYLVSSKDLPPFLSTLNRFMNHRIWEKDYHIANQAKIERCMMLVWYVAMNTGMSLDKLEELIDLIIASDKFAKQ
jgi:hypothetical protein